MRPILKAIIWFLIGVVSCFVLSIIYIYAIKIWGVFGILPKFLSLLIVACIAIGCLSLPIGIIAEIVRRTRKKEGDRENKEIKM